MPPWSVFFFTTRVNHLLFHSLAEIFSIVVGCSIFMISWNSRHYATNSYLAFLGVAYLFIALIDLLHTLAYKGMPIFTDYDFYANQLWIGARYLEAVSLLVAFLFLGEKRMLNFHAVVWLFWRLRCFLSPQFSSGRSFPNVLSRGGV